MDISLGEGQVLETDCKKQLATLSSRVFDSNIQFQHTYCPAIRKVSLFGCLDSGSRLVNHHLLYNMWRGPYLHIIPWVNGDLLQSRVVLALRVKIGGIIVGRYYILPR